MEVEVIHDESGKIIRWMPLQEKRAWEKWNKRMKFYENFFLWGTPDWYKEIRKKRDAVKDEPHHR